uniref:Replicase large subunit n=1 Tax=Macrophomina phaseolina tobamo-like virus 2 TaxID=2741651 RepID=A0A7U3W8K7_9VIRU|nr:RNA-dependent RNA polymerase [Macrophomina phaseolina tobamo-like virus 2]
MSEFGYAESGVSQSVGKALSESQAITTTHPLYRAVSSAVEQELGELTAKKGASRASGRPTLVFVALQSDELSSLSQMYPEFNLVNYGSGRPAHAWWTQCRRLGNEWLALQAEKVGTQVVHYGGMITPYLLGDMEAAAIVVEQNNVVAVHERHGGCMEAYTAYSQYARVSQDFGHPVRRDRYEDFLRRESFKYLSSEQELPQADVICVDGTLNAYGPAQVATFMELSGASVAYGMFVYHPSMLLNDRGELPFGGVHFRKQDGGVSFQYPEGCAGVTRYPKGVWEAWLSSHVFSLGADEGQSWYQLELLKNRGNFMFYRITSLPCEPEDKSAMHALDVEGAVDNYVVQSWELGHEGANPRHPANWKHVRFLASRRLVDRTYQFAMQLPKEQFTRYAVRKQLQVVNDRVTVEGTSVRVNSPLGLQMLERMTVAIYVKAFVDRFESGELTREAMDVVKQLAGFDHASYLQKTWTLMRLCAVTVWEYSFGVVNEIMRDFFDWVRDVFSSAPKLSTPQVMRPEPYFLISEGRAAWFTEETQETVAKLASERTRIASLDCVGFASQMTSLIVRYTPSQIDLSRYRFRVSQMPLFDKGLTVDSGVREVFSKIRSLNLVDEAPVDRRALEVMSVTRQLQAGMPVDFTEDADPIHTLNGFYMRVCPGVPLQNLEYDTASISLDPQDRTLAAPYLRLPRYFGEAPRPRKLFHSRLRALNVPKRQGTLQELLSSMAARNLNAPQVALPQDEDQLVQVVWNKFLDEACVPGARDLVRQYQTDPVAVEEQSFYEWAKQSTPDKLRMVRAELEQQSKALEEMDVGEYLVMLKADVKPTLSTKPLTARTEPQVIVYHEKALSALYSSIMRVLVRRFLSLLLPKYHVNLLKDMKDIEGFLNGIHPFGQTSLKYLENDFSKYDKSQGRFVFALEEFVFTQLGMNADLLTRWVGGHVECSMRSLALGLSLHVMYQRKSGDATTAFGNVLLNILSVTYAYTGTNVIWALFMGDDSLVCASQVGCEETAAQTLAEVFNLGAKTYVTDDPYFASCHVIVDDFNEKVHLVADPVKRVERWSMAIPADDPQWRERYVSARDSLSSYLNCFNTVGLERAVSARYPVGSGDVQGVAAAVATLISSEDKFRSIWEEEPEVSNY